MPASVSALHCARPNQTLYALAAVAFVVAALVSAPASALQVTITYTITGGLNETDGSNQKFGGNAPTGGSAVVRWSLTSLNGNFVPGAPGTLLALSLTGLGTPYSPAGFAGLQFTNNAGTIGVLVSGSPPAGGTFTNRLVGHVQAAGATPFIFQLSCSACGTFKEYYSTPYGQSTVTFTDGAIIVANGQEVSRIAVPGPGTGALLPMALAVWVGRSVLRRRR